MPRRGVGPPRLMRIVEGVRGRVRMRMELSLRPGYASTVPWLYLALGIATTVYVAVTLGVFGTLTVDEVIDSGGTALAVAAAPGPGRGASGSWSSPPSSPRRARRTPVCTPRQVCAQRWPPSASSRRHSVDASGDGPAGVLLTAAIAIVLAA